MQIVSAPYVFKSFLLQKGSNIYKNTDLATINL